MKRTFRGVVGLLALGLVATGMTACGADDKKEPELGTLKLPLATEGPSGMQYRLRDATFEINAEYWSSYGGESGVGSPMQTIVSSEDDPEARSISVSLERGYYGVSLSPGWRMEQIDADGTASTVEATLLSSATTWTYVDPQYASWVEYQFGIGSRTVWLNGDLNIGVQVYEDPKEYYGDPGYGGVPSEGGASGVGQSGSFGGA